jgi:hypothetical protein
MGPIIVYPDISLLVMRFMTWVPLDMWEVCRYYLWYILLAYRNETRERGIMQWLHQLFNWDSNYLEVSWQLYLDYLLNIDCLWWIPCVQFHNLFRGSLIVKDCHSLYNWFSFTMTKCKQLDEHNDLFHQQPCKKALTCPYSRFGCSSCGLDLNKHAKKCSDGSDIEERHHFMSKYEDTHFLSRSTFMTLLGLENLSDAQKHFN